MKTHLIQTTSWGCTDVLFRDDGTAVVGLDGGVYKISSGKLQKIYEIAENETDYRLSRRDNFRYHGLTASKKNLYFGYTDWTWKGGKIGGELEHIAANLVCLDKNGAVLWHRKQSGSSIRNVCADDADALFLHLATDECSELLLYDPDGNLIHRAARKDLQTDDIWPFSYQNTFLFTEWWHRSRRLMQLCYHRKSTSVTELLKHETSLGWIGGRPYFPGPYFVSDDSSKVFQTLLEHKNGLTLLTVSQDGTDGKLRLSNTQQIKQPQNNFWSAVPSRDGNYLYIQANNMTMPSENANIDFLVSSFEATVQEYLSYCSCSNVLLRIECDTGRTEFLATFPEEYSLAGEKPFLTEDGICVLVWYNRNSYILSIVYPDGTIHKRNIGECVGMWSSGRTLIVAEHKRNGILFRICEL